MAFSTSAATLVENEPNLPPVRQREYVEGVADPGRAVDLGLDQTGHLARAASAVAGRDRDVLLAANGERQGEALPRGSQPNLPQDAAGIGIEGAEHAVQVAGECEASRGREHSGQERSALLIFPDFLASNPVGRLDRQAT